MNWEAAGAFGEIIGDVGVLVTLDYLATQIRHNTQSIEASSLQSVLAGPRDRYFLPMASNGEMSDIFSRGMNSLDNLDPDEKRRFFYQIYEQLFQLQQVWQLHERKLIPEADYEAWLQYTAAVLRTPGGAVMWPECEKVFTPTIAAVINDELNQHPQNPSFIELLPIFERNSS